MVRLEVERFRGIAKLDLSLDASLLCLAGPGDAGKSTILDAIELVLSPRWNVRLSDIDFYQGESSEPIRISATVVDLPPELLSDGKFGLEVRGWSPSQELHDEPEGDDAHALTVEFSSDETLEPSWRVVNDRHPEGRPISARDRAHFGLTRLGGDPDVHLSWARGSALANVTANPDDVTRLLGEVTRRARAAARDAGLSELDDAVDVARRGGRAFGSGDVADLLEAGIDVRAIGARSSAISLHAQDLPVSTCGTGTRRLLALGLQRAGMSHEGVVLVDEVEHGLEPYRLRHLLRSLRELAEPPDAQGGGRQVIMTTHSPITLEELRAEELGIVQRSTGEVAVRNCDKELQAVLRGTPEAFLAQRILVCEGSTELGLCRGFTQWWAAGHDGKPVAHTGATFARGGGTEAARRAGKLRALGFECALFADSDVELTPSREELERTGVTVIQWEGEVSTEERLARDLPWETIAAIIAWKQDEVDVESIAQSILSRAKTSPPEVGLDPVAWPDVVDEHRLRTAFAETTKDKKWFKRIDWGEDLAMILRSGMENITDSDLFRKLDDVGNWIYG